MAKIRVKVHSSAARALLNSAEVQGDLGRRAAAIGQGAAVQSGGFYESSVQAGKNRARASVITADFVAMKDNAKNNTLLRNLDRGRS